MLNMQSKLISISKNVLEDSDREHNSVNSASITEFPNNSFVLVTQRTSPDTRLHTLWRGPMKVIDHKQGEYTLLDLTTNKEKRYHSTQMKPFFLIHYEQILRMFLVKIIWSSLLKPFYNTLVISKDYQPYNLKSYGLVMMKHIIHGSHGPI
jgi:hypothetical protein